MNTFDINNCTVQEACDYAIKQLVKQQGPCVDNGGSCIYGDGQGNHCGIGWLLDPTVTELMDYESDVKDLVRFAANNELPVPDIIKNNTSLFFNFQRIHDLASVDAYTSTARKDYEFETFAALHEYGIDTSGEHWQAWMRIVDTLNPVST